MWAAIFCVLMLFMLGGHHMIEYLEGLNFTEPAFVFVIMAMAGTRPVIKFAEQMIVMASKLIPVGRKRAFYISAGLRSHVRRAFPGESLIDGTLAQGRCVTAIAHQTQSAPSGVRVFRSPPILCAHRLQPLRGFPGLRHQRRHEILRPEQTPFDHLCARAGSTG